MGPKIDPEWLSEMAPDALVLEPRDLYDDAIIGVMERCAQPTIVLYDARKCIKALAAQEGWTYDDAIEWFGYNTSGAWLGEHTPGFLWTPLE